MSGQSGPDVAALLVIHGWASAAGSCWAIDDRGEPSEVMCPWTSTHPSDLTIEQQHRAHLEQVIRKAYANWVDELARRAFVATPATTPGFAVLTALADLLRGQA